MDIDLIPVELRRGHEAGKVVFFCGAGVSIPAGLPSFKELCRLVLTDMLPPIDTAAPSSMEELAWQAFRGCRYDEALGILEAPSLGGYEPTTVRERVHHHLSTPRIRTLSKHLILARLADLDGKEGRLVTTNFDPLFEKAQRKLREQEDSNDCMPTHFAPALPPAKPQTFRGLVYLHGKLGTSVDDRQLVLTTADFGMAYMLEGWALRFSVELFRNYHVVFIGYRVEDPTMRYLVNALAAAREEGSHQFNRPYAFAPYGGHNDPATPEDVNQQWKLKGITPLCYDAANNHQKLWNALQEWANDHRQGLEGRRQKVVRLSRTVPTDENDPAIGEMAWALSDVEVANFFAGQKVKNYLNPGWLIHLQKKGLLSMPTGPLDNRNPIAAPLVSRELTDYIELSHVTLALGNCIVELLDTQEALDWALSEGAVLHRCFRRQVQTKLYGEPSGIRSAFHKIWRVLSNDSYAYALAEKHHLAAFGHCERVRLAPDDVYARRCFLASLRPIPVFNLVPKGAWLRRPPDLKHPGDCCEVEIKLVGIEHDHDIEDCRSRATNWEGALATMADELTTSLREAMDWHCALDLAAPDKDATYSRYPSISPHEQNRHAQTWTQLIALTRDSYDALISTGLKDAAAALVRRWQSLPYPLFRRLALYAATGGRDA